MTLAVDRLRVELGGRALVEDVSLELKPGRVHAVVGESGSGKTLSALAVLGLLPEGAVASGSARFEGKELLTASSRERRAGFAMVLQEPLTALNPVIRIGDQLEETLEAHGQVATRKRCIELLTEVGLPEPDSRVRHYPHQLSGGQRQRVAIACALAASPKVLIADEPTTALDASLRGVILRLLQSLARSRSMAVWLITHDLFAVRGASDDLTVMYAGRVVEHGLTEQVLASPRHPYTAALLRSNPAATPRGQPLPTLEGTTPGPAEVIPGCRFNPRCERAQAKCLEVRPELTDVACHFPLENA
ncbi:MAG TPA: ABC transporter ATP-binding protein, partial [Archangium sp.]